MEPTAAEVHRSDDTTDNSAGSNGQRLAPSPELHLSAAFSASLEQGVRQPRPIGEGCRHPDIDAITGDEDEGYLQLQGPPMQRIRQKPLRGGAARGLSRRGGR